MDKMLNVFVIASALSLVCGKQYAYFGDNLVEFDDVSSNSVSVPYPYREPHVVTVEHQPVSYGVSLQSPTQVQTSQITCLSPIDLFFTMIKSVYSYIKSTIMFVFKSIPALIFGCFSFFGVCSLTSACNYLNIDSLPYVREITSYVTPERLRSATEFVTTAIQKYRELQTY